jgi:hypothetical protein
MSSVLAVTASPVHASRFFVNIAATQALNAAGAGTGAATGIAANTVVRDMGKTIRTPAAATVGSLTTQVILRKVARVNTSPETGVSNGMASTFNGFVESNEDSSNIYYTFYINLLSGNWVSV